MYSTWQRKEYVSALLANSQEAVPALTLSSWTLVVIVMSIIENNFELGQQMPRVLGVQLMLERMASIYWRRITWSVNARKPSQLEETEMIQAGHLISIRASS